MWSDNEAKADLLRFKYLTSSVCKIVKNDRLSPATIGLFGDWGSGKSTLLKLAQNELQNDKTVLWVEFNGWLFEGYADARSALMGTVLDSIKERIKDDQSLRERTEKLFAKLFKRVNWFNSALTLGKYTVPLATGSHHMALAFAAGDVAKMLKEDLKEIPGALEKIDPEKCRQRS